MIHCTASRGGTAEDVVRLHRNVFKWSRVGYRIVVEQSGKKVVLADVNQNCIVEDEEITFGAAEHNAYSHHICYIGGIDEKGNPKDTRTPAQIKTLAKIVYQYVDEICPEVLVAGHNQFHNRGCPSFWVPTFCRQIGIDPKNIYEADPFGYSKILK